MLISPCNCYIPRFVRGTDGGINPASIYWICRACSAPERVTLFHLHPAGAFSGSPVLPLKVVGKNRGLIYWLIFAYQKYAGVGFFYALFVK